MRASSGYLEACSKTWPCPESPFLGVSESLRIRLPKNTPPSPQKELFVGIRDKGINRGFYFSLNEPQRLIERWWVQYSIRRPRFNFATDSCDVGSLTRCGTKNPIRSHVNSLEFHLVQKSPVRSSASRQAARAISRILQPSQSDLGSRSAHPHLSRLNIEIINSRL